MFHLLLYEALESEASTPLADFFSSLLVEKQCVADLLEMMAGDADRLSMLGFLPALIQGRDGMSDGTACRLTCERNGHSATYERSCIASQDDGRSRFPAHCPHQTVIVETAS